jgi:hypothetical protein
MPKHTIITKQPSATMKTLNHTEPPRMPMKRASTRMLRSIPG